ncbi:hypothetical protein R5M92_03380 [Halomonas sp. Bachu 37]
MRQRIPWLYWLAGGVFGLTLLLIWWGWHRLDAALLLLGSRLC